MSDRASARVRAAVHVDVKHVLAQPRPGNATAGNLRNMLLHGVNETELEILHGNTPTKDWGMLRELNSAKKPDDVLFINAAALAVAQSTKASGLDFLQAVVLGDEVSTRIGVVMGRPHGQFWHNTGTMGSFGAAAAAGGLMRQDEDACAQALPLAATCTAGLQQAFRSEAMAKPLHAGRAAEAGVLALQQQHGFTHADIQAVQLGVYQSTLDNAPHVDPQTADQARFSLHDMVASALVHGSVRLSAFEPDRLNDPATRALMQRISKALDAEVDAGCPGRRAARVTITLRDGRVLTHLQPDRKGDPELPLCIAAAPLRRSGHARGPALQPGWRRSVGCASWILLQGERYQSSANFSRLGWRFSMAHFNSAATRNTPWANLP